MKHKLRAIIKYQYDTEHDLNAVIHYEYQIDFDYVFTVHGLAKTELRKAVDNPIEWSIDSGFANQFTYNFNFDDYTIKIEPVKVL